jgi:hypothetical protein
MLVTAKGNGQQAGSRQQAGALVAQRYPSGDGFLCGFSRTAKETCPMTQGNPAKMISTGSDPMDHGQGHMHPRKKATTGCGIGSSAQSRKSFRLKAPVAAPSVGQNGAAREDLGLQKDFQTGQILPTLLLAAKPRLEFLNGKNVFSFQRPPCLVYSQITSSFVRLTNIDIYYFF